MFDLVKFLIGVVVLALGIHNFSESESFPASDIGKLSLMPVSFV